MSAGGSGANAYWPGFVDALTNVVIAMIFVVVVLAISLSFAAQMMGKKLAAKIIQEHTAKLAQAPPASAAPAPPVAESTLPGTTRIAVAGNERAASAPPSRVKKANNTLQLDFQPGALTLDPEAAERFKAAVSALGKDAARKRAEVVATGPAMSMSDNQRAAFTRVMAVRNALLEMGFDADRIQVRIATDVDMPAPSVNVSFTDQP
jgi:outer membrane protein OmpA-like peptidoglycan-associated protein